MNYSYNNYYSQSSPSNVSQYMYNSYYPYSYYTYECAPVFGNCYQEISCDKPLRFKSKRTSIISKTSSIKNVVKLPETPQGLKSNDYESVGLKPINEQEKQVTNADLLILEKPVRNTEDFEFIEIKGIRGIWVKKDSSKKNTSVLINSYLIDAEKEKTIEECEPSDPIIIREKPPIPPKSLSPKLINIPGKRGSPPARRVVIERLTQPPQPQKIIVERWLPYDKQERRVVVEKAAVEPCNEKTKNLIIEWEPALAKTEKKVQILGIETADPNEYVAKYGSSLKSKSELPQFALNVKGPDGIDLNETNENNPTLVGDIEGLNLVDLDKEGLGMYKKLLEKKQ